MLADHGELTDVRSGAAANGVHLEGRAGRAFDNPFAGNNFKALGLEWPLWIAIRGSDAKGLGRA
jgi:hypothetical protein